MRDTLGWAVSFSVEFGLLIKEVEMVHAGDSKIRFSPWVRYSTWHLVGTPDVH